MIRFRYVYAKGIGWIDTDLTSADFTSVRHFGAEEEGGVLIPLFYADAPGGIRCLLKGVRAEAHPPHPPADLQTLSGKFP